MGTLPLIVLAAFLSGLIAPAPAVQMGPPSPRPSKIGASAGSDEQDQEPKSVTTPKKTSADKSSKKKTKKKKPPVQFSGEFALRIVYDDNIIHYSDDDLEEFTSTLNEGKFSITQAGDWIIRPRLVFSAKSAALTGKTLEARLTLSSWRYVENDVKNNESYTLLLKHPGWGKDNFQLTLYKAPFYYIRHFKHRGPYDAQSTPLEYTPFEITSNSATLKYWRRYSKKFDATLRVGRSVRFYNQEFMENDVWEWNFGALASYRISSPFKVSFEYLYSTVNARAANQVGETTENSDDGDGSYERDSYKISTYYYPKGAIPGISNISMKGQYQVYYFTSEKDPYEDDFHVGRKDKIYRFETTWATGKLWGPVSLEGGYRYTERTSSAPGGGDDAAIGEDKDYTDNRFWTGANYPF